ncbi:MAG: hypothetical protein AAF296_10750 [Pseudomonadota bacterium]
MIRFASFLAVSVAFGLAAQAGEAVTFETLDTDGSGLITESEFVGWKTADGATTSTEAIMEFLTIDADGNGAITPEEFDAAMESKSSKDETSGSDGSSDTF